MRAVSSAYRRLWKAEKIADIRFFGDFFAKEGIEEMAKKLVGCPYKEGDINKALQDCGVQDYFYNITLEEILSCII